MSTDVAKTADLATAAEHSNSYWIAHNMLAAALLDSATRVALHLCEKRSSISSINIWRETGTFD
eukprot:1907285-Pyramimonas_sp.AAC.1